MIYLIIAIVVLILVAFFVIPMEKMFGGERGEKKGGEEINPFDPTERNIHDWP